MIRLATVLCSMSLVVPAIAADIAPVNRSLAPAPVPVVLYQPMWLGFYAGANGGYANGGFGGVQAGYNYQFDRWIVGAESDVQAISGPRGSASLLTSSGHLQCCQDDFNIVQTNSVNFNWHETWFATFRGRAGWLVRDDILLYATGGLAVAGFDFNGDGLATAQMFNGPPWRKYQTPAGPPIFGAFSVQDGSATAVGWTAGLGVEKKFNQAWSVKAEYLYMDFGSRTVTIGDLVTDVHPHENLWRLGVNYAFR
jgi:outer membrane immunogenic protein